MAQLRPYQQDAINAVIAAREHGVRRMLIEMFTSAGKTVFFSNLPEGARFTGRVLVLSHTEELVCQAADKITRWNPGVSLGIEMAGRRAKPTDRYVVASIQTLCRDSRLSQFAPDDFELIIADECHRAISDSWRKVLRYFGVFDDNAKTTLIGVSATIKRGDGTALATVFDELVYSYDLLAGMKDGWTVDLKGYRIKGKINLDHIKLQAGELPAGELSLTINTPEANKAVVEAYQRYGENRIALVLCVDIAHAKAVAEEFRKAEINAEAIWGDDPERRAKLAKYNAGDTQVMCQCAMLIEGYDNWRISCIIFDRPCRSELLYRQGLGRGGRLSPDTDNLKAMLARGETPLKRDCIVIDMGYATKRHKLTSISSIFGLPPKMSLNGAYILEAIQKVQKTQLTKPTADLSECEDLQKIETHAEIVDLFNVQYEPEVVENSEFQWMPDGVGGYVIKILKEKVVIKRVDDVFAVAGLVDGSGFERSGFKSSREAFGFADKMIRRFGHRYINLLRRTPTPGSQPTEPIMADQVRYLKGKLERMGLPEPEWSKMSRHDGRQLFIKLGNEDQTWRARVKQSA